MDNTDVPGEDQLAIYRAEVHKAISREQVRLSQLRACKDDIESTSELLAQLPDKLSHKVFVPFGSKAFFPGLLRHTNEVTVHLGANYYAECTAAHARSIVGRRLAVVNKSLAAVEKELRSHQARLDVSYQPSVNDDGENVMEIRESYEESQGLLQSAPRTEARAIDHDQGLTDAQYDQMLARLAEMEALEAAADPQVRTSTSSLQSIAEEEGEATPASELGSDDDGSASEDTSALFAPVPVPTNPTSTYSPQSKASTPEVPADQTVPKSKATAFCGMTSTSSKSPAPFKKGFLVSSSTTSKAAATAHVPVAGPPHASSTTSSSSLCSSSVPSAQTQKDLLQQKMREEAFTGAVVERTSEPTIHEHPQSPAAMAPAASAAEAPRASKFKLKRMGLAE